MQILLGSMVFFLVLFLCLGLYVLVYPCHYSLVGIKQKKLGGIFFLHIGFLKLRLCKEENGDVGCKFYVMGRKAIDIQKSVVEKGVKRKNKERCVAKKKEKQEKQRRCFFSGIKALVWRELLEGRTFCSLVDLCKKVCLKIRPSSVSLQGRIGFSDPYYTGLLAVIVSVFPLQKIKLEPDFSQSVCDFVFKIAGRVSLLVLIYYFVRLFFLKPFRLKFWHKTKWD